MSRRRHTYPAKRKDKDEERRKPRLTRTDHGWCVLLAALMMAPSFFSALLASDFLMAAVYALSGVLLFALLEVGFRLLKRNPRSHGEGRD